LFLNCYLIIYCWFNIVVVVDVGCGFCIYYYVANIVNIPYFANIVNIPYVANIVNIPYFANIVNIPYVANIVNIPYFAIKSTYHTLPT